jgi:RimJ/RimL family protein N-acetyltransferase
MELTDGVVTMRAPVDDDALEVARAVRESLTALQPWMPWATSDYDAGTARTWIAESREREEHPFLLLDASGALVGTCGLNHVDPLNRVANLGYWLRTGHTGRGYATRATRLTARYGHEQAALHRLEIYASVRNVASCRVAERAGARFEGVLRGRLLLHGEHHDARMYSLVSGDLDDDAAPGDST